MKIFYVKHIALYVIWGMSSLVLGILLTELVAQYYMNSIAKHGKLMHNDPVSGWKPLANLDVTRVNNDGQLWKIRTNQNGFRTIPNWATAATRRILILGDSFAFGEGVNQQDRFDSIIAHKEPTWSIMNLGVMAYGTDQEFIVGQPFFSDLQSGDIVILLTYFNDYIDILRTHFAGRAKPWFQIHQDGTVQLHAPEIGLYEILRDHSYLMTKIGIWLEPDLYNYSAEDVKQGLMLYYAITKHYIPRLIERGINFVIVRHGEHLLTQSQHVPPEAFTQIFNNLRHHYPPLRYIVLENLLDTSSCHTFFLSDGHWNVNGHRQVGEKLHEYLRKMSP